MQIHSSTTQPVFGGCQILYWDFPKKQIIYLYNIGESYGCLFFCSFSVLGFLQSQRFPEDVTLTLKRLCQCEILFHSYRCRCREAWRWWYGAQNLQNEQTSGSSVNQRLLKELPKPCHSPTCDISVFRDLRTMQISHYKHRRWPNSEVTWPQSWKLWPMSGALIFDCLGNSLLYRFGTMFDYIGDIDKKKSRRKTKCWMKFGLVLDVKDGKTQIDAPTLESYMLLPLLEPELWFSHAQNFNRYCW